MPCSALLPRLFGGLLLGVLPSGLPAQVTPYRVGPGDLVRFRLVPSGGRVAGRVATVTPDTLWLESRPNLIQLGFARTDVSDLQRRVGGPSGAGTGVLVGFGFGAAVGVVWGSLVCGTVLEGCNVRGPLILGVRLGGIGAVAGGVIGAIGSAPKWSIGIWPTQTGSGTAIGVRLTFRL